MAQANLGACYGGGYGVPQDAVEAFKWFRRAALQGDADAQFMVGSMHLVGAGVEKNPVEAHAWLSLAKPKSKGAGPSLAKLETGMSPDQIAAATKRAEELRAQVTGGSR